VRTRDLHEAAAVEATAKSSAAGVVVDRLAVAFQSDRGTVRAFDDVSFTLRPGGFLSILGPSGCGKSTLLRAIADLVQPTSGSISVLGTSASDARAERMTSFVFQDASLLPWRSALENVELPLEIRSARKLERRNNPRELLELVGLGGREKAYPHELSGGMRQRVAIARALVTAPRLLLMDEPFGALDEITRERLNQELLDIWERTGTSIVFVTHSIPEAVFLAERVLVMGPSPVGIKDIVDVNLPFPRDASLRNSTQFNELASELRSILEH
jgi:NitT/TauT family transport system ATP-binding protein